MTPPTALSPYSTAPLLPRVISMRSIESRGMVEKSTPAMSMSLSLRPLMRTRVLEVANAPKPRRSTTGLGAVDAAKQARQLHARRLRDDLLQRLRRRMRNLFGGNDGRRCADDAGKLPAAASARALRAALGCDVRAGPRLRGSCRSTAQRPARRGATPILHRRSVLARVRFGSVGEVTSIGGNCSDGACCACAPEMPSDSDGYQETGGEPEAALPRGGMVEDMVQASV